MAGITTATATTTLSHTMPRGRHRPSRYNSHELYPAAVTCSSSSCSSSSTNTAACSSSRLPPPRTLRPLPFPLLLLVLFLAPLLLPCTSAASPGTCPDWLAGYITFHAAQRTSSDAKYLIHTCHNLICGGVGDRLRGVLWSARLAIATRRVLLLSWSRPTALTHFLRPRNINWTLDGLPEGTVKSADKTRLTWLDRGAPAELQARDSALHDHKVWELEHNTIEDSEAGPGAPLVKMWSSEAACLYQALFEPTELVNSKLALEMDRVLGSGKDLYGAVHLRIGGLVGEGESSIGLHRMSRLTYFMQSVSCLRAITRIYQQRGQQRGQLPAGQGQETGGERASGTAAGLADVQERSVVVSDSNHLRQKIISGILPGLLAPSFTATHLDKVPDADPQLHADTFVALGLLAHAECAVYTDSGFSRMAYYWGYQSCMAILPRYQDSSVPPHFHLCDMSDLPNQ